MASAPRSSPGGRRPWRDRSRPADTAASGKLAKRWLMSILLVILVAAFVWQVWAYFFSARAVFAYLPANEYPRFTVPPVLCWQNDFDAFERAAANTRLRFEPL
ncbi:MAG TPA: hypothetical protein VHV08_15285, partial [Pirellulales bacterium]|nr:hypothetical protein [Pirellulales bacterium]